MTQRTMLTKRKTMKYRSCDLRHGAVGVIALAILAGLVLTARGEDSQSPDGPLPAIEKASWIWRDAEDDVCQIRLAITLEEVPSAASIMITADNGYELCVNGGLVGFDVGAEAGIWNSLECYDIKSRLAQGRNVIGIRGICLGGSRGLVAAVRIELPSGKLVEIFTDESWHVALKGEPEEYSHPEFLEDA